MDKAKFRTCRELIYWARVVSKAVDHDIPFAYNPYEKLEKEEQAEEKTNHEKSNRNRSTGNPRG